MKEGYYIDAHCHLDLFEKIQENVNIEANTPIKTISVTNSPNFFTPNFKLFSNFQNIRIALGLHPELVGKFASQIDFFEELVGSTKYIGEVGLDGSVDFKHTFDLQIQAFERILHFVHSGDPKILTVHSRNAAKETIELIHKTLRNSNCKVILHWFSGSKFDLKKALEYGFFFSVNHKMLSTSKGRQLIDCIPINHILTETDAPFTFDARIYNRLSSLDFTINGLAAIYKMNYVDVKALIYENFKTMLLAINTPMN